MKTKFFKLVVFTLTIGLASCKNENSISEYKYSTKPTVLACDSLNSKLYQEAVYSFEDDIVNFYNNKANANSSLKQAYSRFLSGVVYGGLKYEDIISTHTLDIFEALKHENNLWNVNNETSNLNYKSAVINCIAKNLQDNALKQTLNALLTTNSMSPKLFSTPIMSKSKNAITDKHLACYIALDLYYAKLFNIDLSKINLEKDTHTSHDHEGHEHHEGHNHNH